MEIVQWIVAAGTGIVAAGTAAFVARVGYFQWRTAEHKAVLDLFDRRREIYEAIRKGVAQIVTSPLGLNQQKEIEFVDAMERAYFFFGDDMQAYLRQLRNDILLVRTMDTEFPGLANPDDCSKNRRVASTPNPYASSMFCATPVSSNQNPLNKMG
jgi:hypothetical protein